MRDKYVRGYEKEGIFDGVDQNGRIVEGYDKRDGIVEAGVKRETGKFNRIEAMKRERVKEGCKSQLSS